MLGKNVLSCTLSYLCSDLSRDFFGTPISAGGLEEGGGGGLRCPLMSPGQSPGGDQAGKLPEAPRI